MVYVFFSYPVLSFLKMAKLSHKQDDMTFYLSSGNDLYDEIKRSDNSISIRGYKFTISESVLGKGLVWEGWKSSLIIGVIYFDNKMEIVPVWSSRNELDSFVLRNIFNVQ